MSLVIALKLCLFSEPSGYGEGQVEGAYQWNNQQYESYPSNYDNPNPGLWMGTGGYYAPNYQNNGKFPGCFILLQDAICFSEIQVNFG